MAMVRPALNRSSVTKEMGNLRVVIPTRKNILLLTFMGIWLCGWAAGAISASTELLKSKAGDHVPTLFMVVWLAGWTIGGVFAIYAWMWNLFGKEVVVASKQSLKLGRDLLGLRREREFDAKSISDVRVAAAPVNPMGFSGAGQFWGLPGAGIISFDYGAKTYRFGAGLDEAEAKRVAAAIAEAIFATKGRAPGHWAAWQPRKIQFEASALVPVSKSETVRLPP